MDNNFWNSKYINNKTPWDIGEASIPLKAYIDTLKDKSIDILVPGAGTAHEVIYLYKNGFKNVHICDWSEKAIKNFEEENPDFPKDQVHCLDFFTLDKKFDLILEQTFYCALPPTFGQRYAEKMSNLLKKNGLLVGLYFNESIGYDGPPFGLEKDKYIAYFSPFFDIVTFEECRNSIKPRMGKEFFAKLKKK